MYTLFFVPSYQFPLFYQIFKGHKAAVSIMSVDQTGKTLYTGSADATIKSWDIQTGKLLRVSQALWDFESVHSLFIFT